jgi:hypothetical protein
MTAAPFRPAFALLLILALLPANSRASDSADMLKRLRERDARVDNVSLRLTVREPKRIDEQAEFDMDQFARRKFGLQRTERPASFPEPYDTTLVSNRVLTLRGKELMLATTWITDHHGHPQLLGNPILWRRRAGREASLDTGQDDPVLHIREVADDEPTLLTEYRMTYLFAVGVGYGARLKEVTLVERADDGYRVTGRMRLWIDDETTCELTVDRNLLIRKARLRANMRGRETTFEIETEGQSGEDPSTAVASKGKYLRKNVVAIRDGQPVPVDDKEAEWAVETDGVDFQLTDEAYQRLTTIDETAAKHVLKGN